MHRLQVSKRCAFMCFTVYYYTRDHHSDNFYHLPVRSSIFRLCLPFEGKHPRLHLASVVDTSADMRRMRGLRGLPESMRSCSYESILHCIVLIFEGSTIRTWHHPEACITSNVGELRLCQSPARFIVEELLDIAETTWWRVSSALIFLR